jgi:large subunit ribosomal protein L1
MSLASFGALCRGCAPSPLAGAVLATRAFSTTPAMAFRRDPKPRKELSKKAREAKERRREAKKPRSVYEREKMKIPEAIAVLRVRARSTALSLAS